MVELEITINYKHGTDDILQFIKKYFPELLPRFDSAYRLSHYVWHVTFKDKEPKKTVSMGGVSND